MPEVLMQPLVILLNSIHNIAEATHCLVSEALWETLVDFTA